MTVYTPNSQRDLVRIGFRMEFEDAFREYLVALREKAGDRLRGHECGPPPHRP